MSEIMDNWLQGLTETTAYQYKYTMKRLLNDSGYSTFDELASVSEDKAHEIVENHLRNLNQINRYSVIEARLNHIYSFFANARIYLDSQYLLDKFPDDGTVKGIPFTSAQIRRLVSAVDRSQSYHKHITQTKAVLFTLATSSVSISDMEFLQVKDLIPIKDCYALVVKRKMARFWGKEGYRELPVPKYTTFISPQARTILDKYMSEDPRNDPEDHVFMQVDNAMRHTLRRLVHEAGIDRRIPGGMIRAKHDQGFRARFFQKAQESGMSEYSQNIMNEDAYTKKLLTFDELLELHAEYTKIVPYLAI